MSATERATDTHSPTQSHMCMRCVHDTRHERHAVHTQIHTFHNMAPYPQVRTRLAHTPHAHTPTHEHVHVCAYTHLSKHAVARTLARWTCSWRLCHAPAWRSLQPSRPPTSSVAVHVPLAASHTRRVLSPLPLASFRPSGLHATE